MRYPRERRDEYAAPPPPPARNPRRAKGSVRFRPYDLVVAARTKVEPEYFTVSATGVMRLRRGVQVSEGEGGMFRGGQAWVGEGGEKMKGCR